MKLNFRVAVVYVLILGLGVGAAFGGGVGWEKRHKPAAQVTPAQVQQYIQEQMRSGNTSIFAQFAQGQGQGQRSGGQSAAAAVGSTPAAGSTAAVPSEGATGAFGAMGMGSGTTGRVEKVEGNIVTLSGRGSSVKVQLGSDTAISKVTTEKGQVSDIKEGVTLTVAGDRAADGTISAKTVQVAPTVQATPGGTR
ncbi:MAG: hypothetical protein HY677_00145 [Chloroflexi bacterium]|nr:hypothetical protein [Chloroflexota bacterium]